MTNKQINTAIAEACGWQWRVGIYKNCRGLFNPNDPYLKGYECTKDELVKLPISQDCATRVPNYCEDLNAMHEAEKYLLKMDNSLAYWETYSNRLVTMLGTTDIFHATARQRAEAFLKTIDKWKNEDNS